MAMSDNSYDNIVILNAHQKNCKHTNFIFDESLNIITCANCKKEIDPFFIAKKLLFEEKKSQIRLAYLNEIAQQASLRNRCECSHCGRMTEIIK